MTADDARPESGWDPGWEGHKLAQLRRLARLSLAEKLAWLEDAHRLVRHLRSAPAEPREDPPPPRRT
jgi:hypothetical protein